MDHHRHTDIGYQPTQLTAGHITQSAHRDHRRRMRHMRPAVNSRPSASQTMPHLQMRLKKKQMDKAERDKVQYENGLLLARIAQVMSSKQMDDRRSEESLNPKHKATLNFKRQSEWARIAAENTRLARKMGAIKSEYDRGALKQSHAKVMKTPAAASRRWKAWTLNNGHTFHAMVREERVNQWRAAKPGDTKAGGTLGMRKTQAPMEMRPAPGATASGRPSSATLRMGGRRHRGDGTARSGGGYNISSGGTTLARGKGGTRSAGALSGAGSLMVASTGYLPGDAFGGGPSDRLAEAHEATALGNTGGRGKSGTSAITGGPSGESVSLSSAMADFEQIKSWSIWDLPLQSRAQHSAQRQLSAMNLKVGLGGPRASGEPVVGSAAEGDTVAEEGEGDAEVDWTQKALSSPGHTDPTDAGSGAGSAGRSERARVRYSSHETHVNDARKATRTGAGLGSKFVGGDLLLLSEKRRLLEEGGGGGGGGGVEAVWSVKVFEMGYTSPTQSDVMCGFRVEAVRARRDHGSAVGATGSASGSATAGATAGARATRAAGAGPVSCDAEIRVLDLLEATERAGDHMLSGALSRCRAVDASGLLFSRFSALRATDVGDPRKAFKKDVLIGDYDEESDRSRFLRRRMGAFIAARLRVDASNRGNVPFRVTIDAGAGGGTAASGASDGKGAVQVQVAAGDGAGGSDAAGGDSEAASLEAAKKNLFKSE